MNPRIIDKAKFTLVGFKKRVPMVFEGANPEITKMAGLMTPEIVSKLKAMSNIEPTGIVNASVNFADGRMEEEGELDHYIGVATSSDYAGEFDALAVESGTWAVFESVGPFPDALQEVWGDIYSEWFPSSGYEVAEGPEMLWHESPDTRNPNYRSEIWIPVKKSASSTGR